MMPATPLWRILPPSGEGATAHCIDGHFTRMTESKREPLEDLIEEWRTYTLGCGVYDAADLEGV